jgi:DNA polymerase I
MRLLINNTEQRQQQDRDDTEVVLFGRAASDPTERYMVVCRNFEPYLYGRADDVREKETYLLEQDVVREIEYDVEYDGFLNHEELARIYTAKPQHVPQVKDLLDESWNADVPFTNRFRIDTGLRAYADVPDPDDGQREITCDYREIDPVEPEELDETPTPDGQETGLQNLDPRVVTLDIEVDDRGAGFPESGKERILSIVAHDNYGDETHAFIDLEQRPVEECFPDGKPDGVDAVHFQPNEKQMLIDFRAWFSEMDPDIITGWNADDFDLPFIIDRLEELDGVTENALSPMGWSGVTDRGEPRIKGRTIYDLLDVYKANSFTELDSYRLDAVAKEELGAEKIEFNGTFYDLYQDDPAEFIEYNARDVELTVGIDKEAGVIEFRDVLRREVGVDFEDSYNANDFIEMMCRRKLRDWGKVGPTADYGGNDDYEGAYVFDAAEGVFENVVGIDLASLYPYTMAMINASPETYLDPDEWEFEDGVGRDDNGGWVTYYEADNGARFRSGEDGLFKELVDEAIGLKAHYKEKREAADSDEKYEKMDMKYKSAKTITNSIYGVTGWERFFLYHEKVAEAVTLTGQAVIKKTAEYVEEKGYEVLYGDTDSTYIKMPDEWGRDRCLGEAVGLCSQLNNMVYPALAEEHNIPAEENLWDIEVEAYMKRFFQAGKKKRYAYLTTWKDGRELDEPKPSITGFSSVRSDSSKLTEETEEAVLKEILHGNEETVGTIVFEAAKEIEAHAPDWEYIGIPSGMNKKITDDYETGQRDDYYAASPSGYPQDAHPRAVYNSNHVLDVDIGSGDKPKRVYINPHESEELGRSINVLAFETNQQMEPIEDDVEVNVQRMTESTLIRPLERILRAVGVSPEAAVRGQEQTGLGAFTTDE